MLKLVKPVLDPALIFAKYANDAEGLVPSKFKNNARITLDLNDNVCIEALRNIKANEELFCSYGKSYWKKFSVNLPANGSF